MLKNERLRSRTPEKAVLTVAILVGYIVDLTRCLVACPRGCTILRCSRAGLARIGELRSAWSALICKRKNDGPRLCRDGLDQFCAPRQPTTSSSSGRLGTGTGPFRLSSRVDCFVSRLWIRAAPEEAAAVNVYRHRPERMDGACDGPRNNVDSDSSIAIECKDGVSGRLERELGDDERERSGGRRFAAGLGGSTSLRAAGNDFQLKAGPERGGGPNAEMSGSNLERAGNTEEKRGRDGRDLVGETVKRICRRAGTGPMPRGSPKAIREATLVSVRDGSSDAPCLASPPPPQHGMKPRGLAGEFASRRPST